MSEIVKNKETSGNLGRNLKKAALVVLAAASIEGVGAGITEKTNKVPMTGETIKADLAWPWNLGKSVVEDVQRLFEKKSDVISNFPDKGTLTTDNSITITNLGDIKNISAIPAIPTVKNDIYLLQPIEGLDVTNPVEYGMNLDGKSGGGSPFPEEYTQEAIKNNVRNAFVFKNIPEGSVIVAPVDGVLRYIAFENSNVKDVGATISFTAPDGTEESVDIGGYDTVHMAPLIDSIIPFNGNNSPGDVISIQVKRGQPIMKTLNSGDVSMSSIAQPDKTNSSNIYPNNINLLSLPNPKNGKQAIVIVADQ
jgi:hypothetical protein